MTAANPPRATAAARATPWSISVGRVLGIPIRLHASFLVLAAYLMVKAAIAWIDGAPAGFATDDLVLGACLFASVILHELGHAVAGRRYGAVTSEIVLFPIGGVAQVARFPEKPTQEIVVALAGPAVSFALAALLFGAAAIAQTPSDLDALVSGEARLLARVAWLNATLGAFNLVPAFPMDGGRVLRALLATRMERARATRTAAHVGQALALGCGLLGLFASPMLVVIAVFVFIGAGAEAANANIVAALKGRAARTGMMTAFATLLPTQRLTDAVQATLDGSQRDFPVIDERGVHGLLSYAGLVRALAASGRDALVSDAIDSPLVTAIPDEPLADVLTRMREASARAAIVIDHGVASGFIVPENIAELVELSRAAQGSGPRWTFRPLPT